MAEERVQRRLAAILAADVVGYSRLMGEDETGTLAALNMHRAEFIHPTTAEYRGRIVKLMGDGALVEFPSVVDAVECAVAVQRGMEERNAEIPDSKRITFRIGINLGDIIIEGDDIYGDGVNVAARLEGEADPGGVCISGDAYRQVHGKIDISFEDLGERQLKNITEPVRAYRVSLTSAPSASASVQRQTDKPSIAVLPFENLSGDPEQEYFSDGITEDIITTLSHIRQFQVTARNSTFTYKGQAVDLRSVANELGVRYVLEGSVRKSGERVRITAQLIDGESGNHLWAERYDRNLEDIFAVQDEITQTVVAALQPELTKSEIERARRKPPENLDAWDLYQRGLWHTLRNTKEDIAAASQLYEQAIAADPDFIDPYVYLVECYAHDITFGYAARDPQDAFAPARKAAEIDPQDSLAHEALGLAHYLNKDHYSAIAEFKLAIQLNPSNVNFYPFLGFAQAWSGQAEDALDNFSMAIQLSPRDPRLGWFHNGMGVALLHLQRHEECIEWIRKALRYPNAGWPIRSYLISALAHLDRIDECKQEVDHLLELHPDCTISGLQRSRLTTYQPYTDHYLAGLRKAGLPEGEEARGKKPALLDKPSIAVLPFDNMSGDPEQEYFADGMAEDLITDLSKISSLSVAARNSSFSFKGQMPDIEDVAEKLAVTFVLEGSVRKMGDRLRINAQLIDCADGRHIWAERYDGNIAEIFEFQDAIREQIVSELRVNLTPADKALVERKPTDSVEAYDLFLRGRAIYSRYSHEQILEAIKCLEAAIEIDPNFADAYGYLSYCHFLGWALVFPGFEDDLERAHELAERSVSLDSSSAYALAHLGWVQTFLGRYDPAVANCEKAIALAANNADVYADCGHVLNYLGDPKRALEMINRAFGLETFSPALWEYYAGVSHLLLRQYDEALAKLNQSLERAPMLHGYAYLACAYVELDRLDDARGAIEKVLEIAPRFTLEKAARRYVYRIDEDRNRIFDCLRKAGLPEG